MLFGVPSGILGMVSPTLGGMVGGTGRLIAGLTLAPYSREQEREADRIGVALAARAGWDPNQRLEADWPVKVSVAERYRPAPAPAPR